uniref:Fungal lipase-like domain-containing protein n=1 Tax=Acrobeloides nanus TaxID=290746 RepID=A0A914C6X8_9BILA
MYKVIFLGLISIFGVQTQYPTYDETYAKRIFNLAASAYPVYDPTANGTGPIDVCLSKSFPNVNWDAKQTHTVSCGMENENNECQMLVAVSTQSSTIVLAFRGTIGASQFLNELKSGYDMSIVFDGAPRVNSYFYKSMLKLWDSVIKDIVTNPGYSGYRIIITGHSLGGALASLTAYQIRYNVSNTSPDQIHLVTFGEPRTGDYIYANNLRNYINYIFRVVHGSDPIPHLPFCSSNSAGGCQSSNTNQYYQHAQEIWYHGASTDNYHMGTYDDSCSKTDGEDSSTLPGQSPSPTGYNGGVVHTHYFDVDISTFGANYCVYPS